MKSKFTIQDEKEFIKRIVNGKKLYQAISATLGSYINEQREKKGMSYRELASETGISTTLLSDAENGIKIPRFETLIRIALALDIPLNKIFGQKLLPPEELSPFKFKTITDNDRYVNIQHLLFNKGLSKSDVKEIMGYIEYKINKAKEKS